MKRAGVLLLMLIQFSGCNVEEPAELDLPEGILEFIAEIQQNSTYIGTRLYQYHWKESYYYEFDIPFFDCIACYLFDDKGARITLMQDDLVLYISERGPKMLIWQWKK